MGIIIFLMALVVEITFAVFCIITKSYQIKVKSIVKITEFLILFLLILLSIIDWSFHYYSLTALWLLLAVIGILTLVRKKEEKKAYKAVRILFKALGMSMLIFTLTRPAIIFPDYKMLEASGEYKVVSSTYTHTDINRVETFTDTGEYRKLNVQIWYPLNHGKYPPIIY